MDFSNKKLLILAGAGTHSKVVRAAKEMGIYTIVTDYLHNSPAKLLADESWMYSITDVEAITARCQEVGIDGVLNFCIDPAQWPYFEICKKLNLPCYVTASQLEIMTNKLRFKRYCLEHGVDVIPEYSFEEIDQGQVEYPLFIKPSVSRGSRSQFICGDKESAVRSYAAAAKESTDNKAICEKYMGGKQDIGSAWFVIDGEPHLVKLGDRLLGKQSDNLANQVMCTRLPSASAELYYNACAERVKSMIRSLGIRFGPVFLQGFLDGKAVRFYDPALRMPGGDYDLILKRASGFDTVKTMIRFALTGDTSFHYGEPEGSYLLNGGTALLFTFSTRPGRIAAVSGLDTLLKHPNVVYGRQIISAGSVIPNSGDIKQRVAAIGAYLPMGSNISDFVDEVYQTYHVYDENHQDMIVSKITGLL